jgi:hypothetical protein
MESAAFFLALAVLVGLHVTAAILVDRDPTLPLRRPEG